MKYSSKTEAFHDINRINTILQSGIFNKEHSDHPLRESAFVELMILLRDLMAKSELYSGRINFTDDLNLNKDTIDITDTIRHVRDSICHLDSGKRHVDKNKTVVAFCSAHGKSCLMKIGDIELKSEYEDDVCFFYGSHRLYLKRHILRAFNEATKKLQCFLR